MPRKKYYRRPDGLYETTRTINGKRVRFRGRTCAEVDAAMLSYREKAERGRDFTEVADEWYEQHEKNISINSVRAYSVAIRRLKQAFPGPIRAIRPLDLVRYINGFAAKGYAKNTVSTELSVAKMIFAHAVLAGDIDISPATEVKCGRGLPQKKRSALTEDQEILVERYRGEDWLLGYMLLYTGARKGELLALEWRDIDFQRRTITINKKLNFCSNRPLLEFHTKSENGMREIPLLAPLAEVLPRNRIGRIFTGKNGDYVTGTEMARRWKAYCRNVGLVEKRTLSTLGPDGSEQTEEVFPITMHCFRHSFATMCYEAGIDPKSAASYLGDTEAIMRDVYISLRDRHRQDGAGKINEFLAARRRYAEG